MGNIAAAPARLEFTDLENRLQDPCPTPLSLPLRFLEVVTCDFSNEREVGRGGYGVVYMGLLTNGKKIAVKKLLETNLDDEQFQNEVTYLMGVKHPNIVQLIGYCAESRWEATLFKGKHVLAEIPKRLICFEYLNNSNVRTHLSDPSCGLEWEVRYKIIKEICLALDYLHSECNIVHLDLKPENILLDTDFAPKVADFGISRLFGQHQSRIITATRWGTLGYMAPEYIRNGLITTKADMFSFGTIIIELMTGSRDYPVSTEAFECFIQNVTEKWMARCQKTMSYIRPEICSHQLKQCIIAGLNCINPDPKERPSASDIIEMLNIVDSMNSEFPASFWRRWWPPMSPWRIGQREKDSQCARMSRGSFHH